MCNLRLFSIIFLFTGVVTINGEDANQLTAGVSRTLSNDNGDSSGLSKANAKFSILPSLVLFPDFEKPKESVPPLAISKIKGRLLTVEEGCGFSQVSSTKIIGGQSSKIGAWPWIALLAYKDIVGFSFRCGGTLITSRHVLTAAHCVKPNLAFVRLGEHKLGTTSDGRHQDVNVARTEKHINFLQSDMKNDIAVLYLNRDVDFTERIRPICLPIDGPIKHRSFVDTNPFIAGWGAQKEKGGMMPVLQQTQVPVLENSVCLEAYRNVRKLYSDDQFSNEVICAGHLIGGRDSCQGDSGGPLMLPVHENGKFPFYQIGIISYGIGCGVEGLPGGYSNVAHFADWIKEKLRL